MMFNKHFEGGDDATGRRPEFINGRATHVDSL